MKPQGSVCVQNKDDLFAFVYDQYKIELADADGISKRASLVLGAAVLVGTASAQLTNPGLLLKWHESLWHMLMAFFSVSDVLFLVVSVAFLFLVAYPRTYERIAPTVKWLDWLRQIEQHLVGAGTDGMDECHEKGPEDDKEIALLTALSNAQSKNYRLNEIRRNHYQRALLLLVFSTGSMFLLAVLTLCKYVGGLA
ncbi:MAG: hypothetical protein H3C30_05950 [Candidatus Hydrogenedentes bacterium]|nr:hypothetical protein [Candidatus Hydrogenedentota bacterium]